MTDEEKLLRLRHRVEAFNDLAACFELGGSKEAAVACRNAACMEMVGGGVTTFDEIRERKSSEWPTASPPAVAEPT